MDGVLANLPAICDLAEQYDAMVMVDDSHAVGLVGDHGRGTHEFADVMGRIDIITGTLGKALGGASGGYTAGRREVIDWLRQRSRPVPVLQQPRPGHCICNDPRARPAGGRRRAAAPAASTTPNGSAPGMDTAGFTLAGAGHPIIPVMLGDARVAVGDGRAPARTKGST